MWVTAFSAATALVAACQSGDTGAPAIHGVVMERGTNKPLVGSIVVAQWRGVGWTGLGLGSAHGSSGCLHVETTVTDTAGKFVIPAWRFSEQQLKDFTFRFDDRTGKARPYYPAYKIARGPEGGARTSVDDKGVGTYLMEPDTATAEQRLDELKSYDSQCYGAESRRAMRPLYAAMWAEGQPLLPTVGRRFDVEGWGRQAQE